MKTNLYIHNTIIATAFCLLASAVYGGQGAANYVDFDATNPGFGTGADTSETATTWTTAAAGNIATIARTSGSQLTIGAVATDFAGSGTFSINLNGGGNLQGVLINSTNANITFTGTANTHNNSGPNTWTITNFATLTINDTRQNFDSAGTIKGLNWNNVAVTFQGPGTFNFATPLACNSTAANTCNMTNGVINLQMGAISPASTTCSYKGGFALNAGTLNFASAGSATAFAGLTNGQTLALNGGTIDNTSGSPIQLVVATLSGGGPGFITLGGTLTFIGSSSLDLGTAAMTNTANHMISVGANTLALGSAISGPGNGITKIGTGTLQLYGASTYSGSTFVNAGTLALTNAGSIANSPLVVSNATFDVSGLNPDTTTLTSFSVSNSTLVISGSTSLTNIVAATLNPGGTTNIINISDLPLITSYPATFHLIAGATVSGTLNFGLGTLPPSSPVFVGFITNRAASGSVDLILTTGPAPVRNLSWNGTNANTSLPDGTWDVGNTPTWRGAGNIATTFNQLDIVTFDYTAAGLTTVTISANVTPGTLTVSNNARAYTFNGGSSISDGDGSLTLNKKGSGTLTLQESGDNFTGGINVSGGTVVIDNNSGLITGGATIGAGTTLQLGLNDSGATLPAGIITDNGLLLLNRADDFTLDNAITGNGIVNQVNSNVVALTGTSSGNWSVNIFSGTVQVNNSAALGALPGGSVTVTNGGTLDLAGFGTQNTANFAAKQINIAGIGVAGNGAIVNNGSVQQQDAFQNVVLTADTTVGGASRWDIRGGAALLNLGGFTLTKTNANQISLVSPHVTSGNIVIEQGILSVETTPTFDTSAGSIIVSNGAYLGQFRDTLGSFTRSIVLNGGGITNLSGNNQTAFNDAPILLTDNSSLGAPNATEFFNGIISDGGRGFGLTQFGFGTNILAATNTYSGNTVVTGGRFGLTNHGSIFSSPLIIVTNGAAFDVSGVTVPFSGSNSLLLGDDVNGAGTLIVGTALITNFNAISLSNAVLQIAVADTNVASITVTNLNLGDGTVLSTVNITALPLILPGQFPLIKYGSTVGTYNLTLGTLPAGYAGNLVNNTGNKSIDLLITQIASGLWNGGSLTDNNWSDAANWNNTPLTTLDPLTFTGSARLNNTNDTGSETATSITFVPGAGAFTLNGNAVALAGSVTNRSSNPQTIDLGLTFGANGTNITLDGGSSGLTVGGGLTSTIGAPGWTTLTLTGNGTITNIVSSTTLNPGGTNEILMNNFAANWTLMDNSSATPMSVPWLLNVNAGTFNFGSGASAPNLSLTTVNGQPQDNQVGAITGTSGTFNFNNGTLTTVARLNTATANVSTGIVNQAGGTLNIGQQFQGANGGTSNALSKVTVSGGTMNVGGGTGPLFVASRDQGILAVNGSGIVNCGNLDVSRDAQGNSRGSIGVVNLDGGTLTVSRVGTATANSQAGPPSSGVTPTATFNFNGGTLKARAASTTFIQGSTVAPIIPVTTVVKSGGAIIDDGGFAISILEPLQHDSSLGTTPDGGLTKKGSGTLTLAANNSYIGSTTVSNGTLAVNGSIGASALTVAGGILAGSGSIGSNVTVNAGASISPGGPAALGNLTVAGNVTLQAGSAAIMELNKSLATSDLLLATNTTATTITYAGTLAVTNLAGTLAGGDTFKLFSATNYVGSFTLQPAQPAIGLKWDTSQLNVSGTLRIVALPRPGITGVIFSGGNVTIGGTNGTAGFSYRVLGSTNVSAPLATWTILGTNVFDGSGNFSFTTSATNAMQFFTIQAL